MLPMLSVLLIVFTLIMVLRKFAVIELWNSTQIIFKGLALPRRGILINILHPVYDLVVINGSFILSILLFETVINERDFIYRMVISSLIIIFTITFSRSYKVYWLRAGTPDYLNLFYAVTFGFIVVLSANVIVNNFLNFHWSFIVLLPAYLISIVGILGERLHLKCLQLMLSRYFHDSEFNKKSVEPALIYGAGTGLAAYHNYSNLRLSKRGDKILGIIDNDLALSGMYVYGYKILGDISKLDLIYKKCQFKKIIVTIQNPIRNNYELLKDFCSKNDIKLVFFHISENDEPSELREEPFDITADK